MNPGFDLLMAADWEALLEGRVVKDPPLPPLVGMSAANVLSAASRQALESNRPPQNEATPAPSRSGGLKRNLLVVLVGAVMGLGLATLFFKLKSGGRPR